MKCYILCSVTDDVKKSHLAHGVTDLRLLLNIVVFNVKWTSELAANRLASTLYLTFTCHHKDQNVTLMMP